MVMRPDTNGRVTKAIAPAEPINVVSPSIHAQDGVGQRPMYDEIPTPWYLDVAGVWRRHRWEMIGIAIFGLVFGFLLGALASTPVWAIQGRLRYIAPPNVDGQDIYKPLSLLTYCDLVLSDENLESLASEFRDRLPGGQTTKYLKGAIRVEAPRNTEIIELTMDAADPDLGVSLVNRLMQLHIDYTNELRRTTTLRQAEGLLRSRIEKNDAQIRKWGITIEEYTARLRQGAPLERLDQVEVDPAYTVRRRHLLDDIKAEQGRLAEVEIELTQKQNDYRLAAELAKSGSGSPVDLASAQNSLKGAEIRVKNLKDAIARKQEDFRNLPLEYANFKILEHKVQRRDAEQDLKQLSAKLRDFGVISPAFTTTDSADESWTRLRQRLLGADAPEFDVLKPATLPPFPTSSNRKALTAAGFALPLLFGFLFFAFLDHKFGWRTLANGLTIIDRPAKPVPAVESPLLTTRINQWLTEPKQADGMPQLDSGRSPPPSADEPLT